MSELSSTRPKEIFSAEWNKDLLKKILGIGVVTIAVLGLLDIAAGKTSALFKTAK